MAPTPPSADSQKTLADFVAHVENNGITLGDVGTIVKSLPWKTAWAMGGMIFAAVSALFSAGYAVGYWVYPLWNNPKASVVPTAQRAIPTGVQLGQILFADDAREKYPWLAPTISYLEDEGADEKEKAAVHDYLVIVAETSEFGLHTSSCRISLITPSDQQLTGSGYRTRRHDGALTNELLSFGRTDRVCKFNVPPCDPDDYLIFVVKVTTEKLDLPTDPDELRPSITLRLEKAP